MTPSAPSMSSLTARARTAEFSFRLPPIEDHVWEKARTSPGLPVRSLSQSFKGEKCSITHASPHDSSLPKGSRARSAMSSAPPNPAREPASQDFACNAWIRPSPSSISPSPARADGSSSSRAAFA